MPRKRLTQLFPCLLPLREKQRKLCFYLKMRFDKNTYVWERQDAFLPYQVFKTESPLLNENSGQDMQYQYNKVHNLKLAANKISGLVIRPNQTFSFCLSTKDADKLVPFKDGLSITNGKLEGICGGGLCQMSNMLFWMFLHTPLTVVERHGHAVEYFPSTTEQWPLGIDATVHEGWLDFKISNNTPELYQIRIDFDEFKMYGEILSDKAPDFQYEIFNSSVRYRKTAGKVYREALLNCRRKEIASGMIQESLLDKNVCEIRYPLPLETMVKEKEEA